MKTLEYLEEAAKKAHAQTNAELARRLGIGRAAITKYKNGDQVMDDYTAARVAEMLGIDPMIVIAQANAEREKDEKKAAFWRKFAAAASVFLTVSYLMTAAPKTAYATMTCSGQIHSNANYGALAILRRVRALLKELARTLGGFGILRTT